MTQKFDDEILQFATPKQRYYYEAYTDNNMSARKAAKKLGVHHKTVQQAVTRVREKAVARGYSPKHDLTKPMPEGFGVKRISQLRDADGNLKQQWIIGVADQQKQLELLKNIVLDLCADVSPLPPVPAPSQCDDRLLTVIPLGDPHFGLLTWGEETGEDFDLEIAERLTYDAVDRLCARTPSSKTALLLNLGDFFHADNSTNRTPRSGAYLDVDGRFEKIARVGVTAMVRCIRRLLEKHEHVIVKNNKGNHDPHQSAMLSVCLNAWFHDNPRVTVDDSPSPFYYLKFGKTLIGSTHGDGAKLAELPLIMATDQRESWGATDFHVWHCGHFHHDQVKDMVGCRVETHRTLAASDAWHNHSGYRSHRDLKAIVYDIEFGEVMRLRCGVEQVT